MRRESSDSSQSIETGNEYSLQCMDLWSGNESAESFASTPAFDIAVYSQPYQGESSGGDVHYVTLCAGGIVTRLILADVSGHGNLVAETSQGLRSLMRRFMNSKSQLRLVRALNREFSNLNQSGRFATALVATYVGSKQRFTLCNAGHPRPLWFQRATSTWSYLSEDLTGTNDREWSEVANLPWGIDDTSGYQQFSLKLKEGDIVLLYTDALTETSNPEGKLLGEPGLKHIVESLPTDPFREFGPALLEAVRTYSGNRPAEDDLTIIALMHFPNRIQTPGFREKLAAYAKMLGIKSV